MVRSRWAALALGCCALFISGCGNWFEGGWFSRFRTTSLARDCDCPETAFGGPVLEGGPLLGPHHDGAFVEGPFAEPQPFGPQVAPPPAPQMAPPPRIVPIPHAAPVPYSPTH